MKYFWYIMAAVLAVCIWIVNSSRSDVKLFCYYGKVFVEFHDGSSVWGTMWLDDEGLPVPCNTNIKTKLKDTI